MNKKAAFQLSLGLIVTVVVAVVLLSLLILWLQNMIPGLERVTHQVTELAQQKLMKDLSQTGEKVGIAAPAVTTWKRGETGSFAVGIRNKYSDKDMKFYINVYLEKLGGDLSGTPAGAKKSEVDKWLTYSSSEFVERGKSKPTSIIIKPPASGTDTGIYLFRVVVCERQPCVDLNSPSVYGSAQFAIEIESV
jgi:hypothetical protein